MVTHPILFGLKIQSTQYWPETPGESLKFNNFLVKTIKAETSDDYVVSTLELINLKVFYAFNAIYEIAGDLLFSAQ